MCKQTVAAILWLTLLALMPASASAQNVSMYDNTPARTRLMVDQNIKPGQLYLSVPLTFDTGTGQQSFSTPTIVGNDLYQYTYSGGTGQLSEWALPVTSATQLLMNYSHGQLPLAFHYSGLSYGPLTITFHPSQGAYGTAGQDSVVTSQGHQAIAVGRTLYTWPQNSWPAQGTNLKGTDGTIIRGNPGNNRFQVDMSALITPPVPVPVMTPSGPSTLHLPMAVAGSWNGGLVAKPLGLPKGDQSNNVGYQTTMGFPADVSAALTSDPTFISSEPLFRGDPAVAFGVASSSYPRIELLDLVTGQFKEIGVGVIQAQVPDTVLYDQADGVLVVQDIWGALYTFSVATGNEISSFSGVSGCAKLWTFPGNKCPAWINSTPILGQDMSLVQTRLGRSVIAVGDAGSTLGFFSLPDLHTGTAFTLPGMFRGQITSPTTLIEQGGKATEVFSDTGHQIFINGPGTLFGGRGTKLSQAAWIPTSSSYIGYIPDAGPQHWIIGWSNSGPFGSSENAFLPVTYQVLGWGPSHAVPSGGTATVQAHPIPSGVTFGGKGFQFQGPMYATITGPAGAPIVQDTALNRAVAPSATSPWSLWQAPVTLPPNTTGKSETWTVVIHAMDRYGTTASSQPITVTEQSGSQPPPPPQTGKKLKPVTPTGTLNLIPNPALWGQTVKVTLTPKTPATPTLPLHQQIIPGWTWQIESGTQLYWPKRPPTWAFAFPVAATVLQSESMTVSADGHSARATILENWWDGGCQTPQGICSQITSSLYTIYGQGPEYIPAHSWPVKAQYTIQITYQYHPWGQTGCVDTDATKEASEVKTDKETSESCTPTFGWLSKVDTGTITLPAAWATANLNTNGTALDSVGGG